MSSDLETKDPCPVVPLAQITEIEDIDDTEFVEIINSLEEEPKDENEILLEMDVVSPEEVVDVEKTAADDGEVQDPLLEANNSPVRRKRGSTIDVVNCEETTECSETGSLGPVTKENEDQETELFDFREMAAGAMRHAEELVRRFLIHVSWTVCHFHSLPRWLQDNDFIWQGYRPPLPSFWDCIKSIFSIHTETGNIWTHMLGNIFKLEVFNRCLNPTFLFEILANEKFKLTEPCSDRI